MAVSFPLAGRLSKMDAISVIFSMLLGSYCAIGLASEGGGQNVPAGAKTIEAALLPAPGDTAIFGYELWVSAPSVRDNKGKSAVPGFHVDLLASATQFAHTWTGTLLDLNLSSNLIFILDGARVKAGSQRDTDGDLSEFIVQPIVFTWAWNDWHFLTGPMFFVPVGSYSARNPGNAAAHYAHYVTLAYETAITWMPRPWFEFSLHPTIGKNLSNPDTGYRSGVLTVVDWGMITRPLLSLPQFGVGLGGYYEHQLTDDAQNGHVLLGRRVGQSAAGPQFLYDIAPGFMVALKYQREFNVVNSARGGLLWLEFAVPLNF